MKANRKFLSNEDEAVSPVIAVILMVAITVVLAATVYVWVSGFSGDGGASSSISLSSDGPYDDTNHRKTFSVAAATPGLKYQDLKVTVDGSEYSWNTSAANSAIAPGNGEYGVQQGGSWLDDDDTVVGGGDLLRIEATNSIEGATLRVIDLNSNSVIHEAVIG